MFDVGFSEMMLIAVVALVVIGPERLPAVARTLGHLFGRLQRYVNDVKADISREIELDELKKYKSQFEEAAQSVESGVRDEVTGAEATLDSIAAEVNPGEPGATEASAPAAKAVPGAPEVVTANVTANVTAEGVVAGAHVEAGAGPGAPGAAAPAAALPAAVEQKTAA
jgi:sec-independent protein translocase protein TatB